jgi:ribosomal-protein-alanine N-acetyltransferase
MAECHLDEVVALEQAIFPSPWPRKSFTYQPRRRRLLKLVAVEQGRVTGYLVVWGGECAHVANLAVAQDSRRKGIGSLLMDRAEKFAVCSGADLVVLEARRSNSAARAFYRDRGYDEIDVRLGYYENGEDAIVMAKSLVSG